MQARQPQQPHTPPPDIGPSSPTEPDRIEQVAAAQSRTDAAISDLADRTGACEIEIKRLWDTLKAERQATAGLLHKVDRLEGEFESQWAVLRRLELEHIDTRRHLDEGLRTLLAQATAIVARTKELTETSPPDTQGRPSTGEGG